MSEYTIAPPATPTHEEGDLVYDQQHHRLMYFDGTTWQQSPITSRELAVIAAAKSLLNYVLPRDLHGEAVRQLNNLRDALAALDAS